MIDRGLDGYWTTRRRRHAANHDVKAKFHYAICSQTA